jgi:hypothetical protein
MKLILAGLLLLTGVAAQGQETADTSKAEDSAETQKEQAIERDSLEPGVTSTELSADVRRGAAGGRVMDELDLGRTEIKGNQELPKVLYIVPWQKSDPGDLSGKPVNSLLDEVMAPLDRTEFIRQVEYYDDLYGEKKE